MNNQKKSGKIVIPAEIWEQIESKSEECKRAWGMGFPVISITLLKQILKRENTSKPTTNIEKQE